MSEFPYAAVGGAAVPRRVLRRRFLLVAIALLAILGPLLGVSYLGSTGAVSTAVTASAASNLVEPVDSASGADPAFPTSLALKYGSTSLGTGKLPAWTPAANTAGQVTSGGDLALVDATGGNVLLNVYITNLVALGQDYQSFVLPINVYSYSIATSTWSQVPLAASSLLSSQPNYSIQLAAGSYYDVTLDAGGSYYCVSTTSAAGALAPSFYFSAQAL